VIAGQLLKLAEIAVRHDDNKRHIEGLVAAHERLWELKHRSSG
jgi:hypothetical protein